MAHILPDRDLEQRVAALEARLAPLHLTYSTWEPLTEAQETELRESITEALEPGPPAHRILPEPPPLAPAQVRYLLRQCVTVVKPGETLVVRVPWTTTPSQLYEYQRVMDSHEGGEIPFKVLVVAGDELGTVQSEPEFMQHVHAEPLRGHGALTIRLTHQPTGITIAARDHDEGIYKLRKALADAARRQYDLQEAERRTQRKTTPRARRLN